MGALEDDLFLCPFVTHFGFCPWGSYLCPLPLFLLFPLGLSALFTGFCQGFIKLRTSHNQWVEHPEECQKSTFFQLCYFFVLLFAVCCFRPISTCCMKQIASTYSDTIAKTENPIYFFIAFEHYNYWVLGSILIY